ncbi:MAG TPA: hypothetical protein V6D12_19030 [Candidatus Obscuribacterales bacterium]
MEKQKAQHQIKILLPQINLRVLIQNPKFKSLGVPDDAGAGAPRAKCSTERWMMRR